MKVRAPFQFPALMYPNFFHRSTRYRTIITRRGALKRTRNRKYPRCRTEPHPAEVPFIVIHGVTLHADIASALETSERKGDAVQMEL